MYIVPRAQLQEANLIINFIGTIARLHLLGEYIRQIIIKALQSMHYGLVAKSS